MLQHVEDELLFDRLPHGVAVCGVPVAAEHGERLVLGGGGEGEETQVRLSAALGHAAEQLLHVFPAFPGRALSRFVAERLAAQHSLELRGRLPALRAVRLIDEHSATAGGERSGAGHPAFLGHPEQLTRHEREFLQGGDDDRHGAFKGFGELTRALIDSLYDAALVFELIDRVLELLIEHNAIRDHAVEDALVGGVVQGREPMGKPSDGVALAAAGGMLDEVVVPHAVPARSVHEHPHGLE